MVRYKLKPSIGTKSHEPKWSSTRHKVIENPTNNQYLIPGISRSKVWLRHGLLKVWFFMLIGLIFINPIFINLIFINLIIINLIIIIIIFLS